MEISTSVVEVE